MDLERAARCVNTLGSFCGRRDIPLLTPQELKKKYGFEQADLMVLFGGSILCGGDVLADAMKKRVAKNFVIVGGAGHTTETLRANMRRQFPEIATDRLPEARIFAGYLKFRYNLEPDYLECGSTNCGNNITCLLSLLKERGLSFRSAILCQDAAMQLRMDAGLRKYVPDAAIVNYAAYHADVVARGETLTYAETPPGMWSMKRYISLLMGEIPRLSDDAGGYGPKGKNFIAHVEIPSNVRDAFLFLKERCGAVERKSNRRYASGDKT